MQDQAILVTFDFGISINGQRQPQIKREGGLEVVDPVETGAELLFQRPPAEGRGFCQDVKPVSQPRIDVKRHGVVRDRTDRAFLNWHRMSLQRLEKGRRKGSNLRE